MPSSLGCTVWPFRWYIQLDIRISIAIPGLSCSLSYSRQEAGYAGLWSSVPCSAWSPLKHSTQLLYSTAAPRTAPAERLTRKVNEAGSLNAAAIPSIASSDALHSAISAELTDAASFGSTACKQ